MEFDKKVLQKNRRKTEEKVMKIKSMSAAIAAMLVGAGSAYAQQAHRQKQKTAKKSRPLPSPHGAAKS